jgi:pyridoxine 4-dehydrogenase
VSIPVVAYSPISRGWLTGKYRTLDDLPANDLRTKLPRFKPEAFEQNLKLVKAVDKIAERKGFATSQVAMAWVTRQGAIPIPGSSNADRIAQNSELAELTEEEMEELQHIIDTIPIVGERYGGAHEKYLNA